METGVKGFIGGDGGECAVNDDEVWRDYRIYVINIHRVFSLVANLRWI